jgi:hypothetical protein
MLHYLALTRVAVEQLELEPAQPPERKPKPSRTPTPPRHPSPGQLLETPGALLTRSHLRDLGVERRAIDAVFRMLPVVTLPGYSRPMIRADHYLPYLEEHTYRDDRVRPCHA